MWFACKIDCAVVEHKTLLTLHQHSHKLNQLKMTLELRTIRKICPLMTSGDLTSDLSLKMTEVIF